MTSHYALKIWCKCGRICFISTVVDDDDFLEYVKCKCGRDINDKFKEVFKDWKEFNDIMRGLYDLENSEALGVYKLWDLFIKRVVASGDDLQEYEEREDKK